MDAWSDLSESEMDAVWKRFGLAFRFRPSTSKGPGIVEPRPFRTFSIELYYGHANAHDLETDLEVKARRAFQECTSSDAKLYALDWQHRCCWLRPHLLAEGEDWVIPALPDGDYYIFLEPTFQFGWFGHPWERSICVFGSTLLEALERHPPFLFSQCMRSAI
jgi:hypothetical protein